MYTRTFLCFIIVWGCADGFDIDKPLLYDEDSAIPPYIDIDQDGISEQQGDCDDDDPDISPLQQETPYDGVDNDCNPNTLDDDLDQDGYLNQDDCDDLNEDVHSECPIDEDNDGFSIENGDCNDSDPEIFPSHPDDTCDFIDNNCNRLIDENWQGDEQENGEAVFISSEEDTYLTGYIFPDHDIDQFILETQVPRTFDIEPRHLINIQIFAHIGETWVELIQGRTTELFSFELYPDAMESSLYKVEIYSESGDCSQPYEIQVGYP